MDTIRVVKECGHSVAGSWSTKDEKGVTCWHSCYGKDVVEVPWPVLLHCRYCQKDFTPEQVRKQWLQPVFFSYPEMTFNCGCRYIDSSD